jgi:hypothetical protein
LGLRWADAAPAPASDSRRAVVWTTWRRNGPSTGPLRADFGSEFSRDGRIRQLDRKILSDALAPRESIGAPIDDPAGNLLRVILRLRTARVYCTGSPA